MKKHYLFVLLAVFSCHVYADEIKAKVIYVFKGDSVGNKYRSHTIVAGVNMGGISDDCEQMIGKIKVEGVQFSESGATLESFRFIDKNGAQRSVPTGFNNLSKPDRERANSFIKVGKTYFAHIEFCGSGSYADLVNMYDINIDFGR